MVFISEITRLYLYFLFNNLVGSKISPKFIGSERRTGDSIRLSIF